MPKFVILNEVIQGFFDLDVELREFPEAIQEHRMNMS